MSKKKYTDEQRKAIKSQRNRDDYFKAKTTQDKVILRLDKGELAKLDAASSASGLSRAAFARLFLSPILDAMSSRLGAIDVARTARRQSLAQFLGHAIDSALARDSSAALADPPAAANEFDQLFGPSDS